MRWIYLIIPAVLIAVVVPAGNLTLGHLLLHLLTPAMAAVPLYLSVKAYRRAGGRRLLNLAVAFGLLFAGQTALSLSMYADVTLYVGDIPLDHLLHFAALVFFTTALLEGRPKNINS
jgi:purine-cytosine permease-like protein